MIYESGDRNRLDRQAADYSMNTLTKYNVIHIYLASLGKKNPSMLTVENIVNQMV